MCKTSHWDVAMNVHNGNHEIQTAVFSVAESVIYRGCVVVVSTDILAAAACTRRWRQKLFIFASFPSK